MMIALLCRPQERVFPVISANLYNLSSEETELTADQQAGKNLLQLANQDFATWQKFTELGLDLKGQLGHLLLQHKLAIEAEIAAKWQRADFFWNQMQIELKALLNKPDLWQTITLIVANKPGVQIMNDPVKLRQHLMNELFINTHCAFYNGLILKSRKLSWKERAFVHIDYIQQLLKLSPVSAQEVKNLLGEAWQTRITVYKEAKKWHKAINCCEQRLKWLPNNIEFQGELVEIYYLKTLSKCWDAETKDQYAQNAKNLQPGIRELRKFLKKYPYNLTIFQLLASLYHLHSVSLVRSHQLFNAFISVQKAITYNPNLAKAYKARNELLDLKNRLQDEMESGVPSAWDGYPLLIGANKGFAWMNAYIDSDEAKETTRVFYIAEAIQLWYSIGLSEPREGWMESPNSKTKPIKSTSKSTKIAVQLWEALNSVLQHPPQTKADVPSVWKVVVDSSPDLAELDFAPICGYLENSLFEDETRGEGFVTRHRVLVTPPTGHSESSPILTPASIKPRLSTEPLLPWLFSAQDKRIKLQAMVASVLIVVTGYIVMREQTTLAVRQKAYDMILMAKQVQNDEAVLKASKEFFNNAPILGKDERMSRVLELYEESLVRYVAGQPGEQLKKDNEDYLELYRQLQKP
ncbi:tetratricopeptide repeat protein [Nostoc punctiforme]|uniref:TPR repeat-containing protein n=1 Tax=Nostoc punctiforme (strain ATCC 29133 / PCC 73102) TaxID=63737 RepID=B2IZZ6_NOSP7|nr:hypothetical protein [Nostoc punctiforme]ACC81767.1 hypothetical protein Npun_R3337 [Nostoc punctiforme PCC 73102]